MTLVLVAFANFFTCIERRGSSTSADGVTVVIPVTGLGGASWNTGGETDAIGVLDLGRLAPCQRDHTHRNQGVTSTSEHGTYYALVTPLVGYAALRWDSWPNGSKTRSEFWYELLDETTIRPSATMASTRISLASHTTEVAPVSASISMTLAEPAS